MWEYLVEAGAWSVGGLVLGYMVGTNLAEIRVRLERIESMEKKREEEL